MSGVFALIFWAQADINLINPPPDDRRGGGVAASDTAA